MGDASEEGACKEVGTHGAQQPAEGRKRMANKRNT